MRNLAETGQVFLDKKILKGDVVFTISLLSPTEKDMALLIPLLMFLAMAPSVSLKDFKFCYCIFTILPFNFSHQNKEKALFCTNLNSLHQRLFYIKFGCNRPSSSGEEDILKPAKYFHDFSINFL